MTNKKTENIILLPSHVKVYRFVEKYMKEHIVSPQVDEISKSIKMTSRQVYRLINDLCALGYMSKQAYKQRSLSIEKDLR